MTIIVSMERHPLLLELSMKPLTGYFKNLKARLDAYSERQLDEMDEYQNRTVI
jgi:hypothetical protein